MLFPAKAGRKERVNDCDRLFGGRINKLVYGWDKQVCTTLTVIKAGSWLESEVNKTKRELRDWEKMGVFQV